MKDSQNPEPTPPEANGKQSSIDQRSDGRPVEVQAANSSATADLPSESEPKSADERGGWRLGAGALWAAIFATLLFGFSFSIFGQIVAWKITGDSKSLAVNICASLFMWIGLLAVPLWIAKNRRSSLVDLVAIRFSAIDLVGLPIGFVCQLLVLPLIYLPVRLLSPDTWKKMSEPAQAFYDRFPGWQVAIFFVLAAVLAPLIEEIVFRGFILTALNERYSRVTAILVSALIFGLSHFEPLQTLGLCVVGVAFGYLRLRTKRIGMSFFAHAGFNSVAVLSLLLVDKLPK